MISSGVRSHLLSERYTSPPLAMTPPPSLNLAEAHIKAELLTTRVLPEEFMNYVLAKRVGTLAEILELFFQLHWLSEPTARIDALTILETPLKTAKSFQEALRLLRAWKYQLLVTDQLSKAATRA
eukprot:6070692-Amphidinium_carterae.1